MDKTGTAFYKSKLFASRIIKLYKYLCNEQKEFVLSKQILRAGTSIGANLAEAECGSSRKDLLNKKYIALKECAETPYWLELLKGNKFITKEWFDDIYKDCEELKKMLTASTKTLSSTLNPQTSTLKRK